MDEKGRCAWVGRRDAGRGELDGDLSVVYIWGLAGLDTLGIGARPTRGIRSARLPFDPCCPYASAHPDLVCAALADGSHLRRSTCASGYGNAETRERCGDGADDTGAVGGARS